MTRKHSVDIRQVADRLKTNPGSGRGRRSPLFRWMYDRAGELRKLLDDVQPSWGSLADALAGTDLTDGTGKLPDAERVRKTWFEVRRAKGWTGNTSQPAAKDARARAAIPSPPAAQDRPGDATPPDDEPRPRAFGTGRLRGHAPSAAQPPVAAPPAQPDLDRAAKVVSELLRNAPSNRFKSDDGE